ncbi:MAG: hypothetical protein WC676_02350 [Candidatus Omnitrophota bacterium]
MKKEFKKQDNLDFEIAFYEGILKYSPNFTEALIALGDHYTKRGLYEKGLNVDERLAKLKPEDPLVFYNLACSYSLLGDIDKSLQSIEQAVKRGYKDFSYLEHDADLIKLRADDRFQQFLSKIKGKADSLKTS